MKFLCGGCGCSIDSVRDLSYTLIDNLTGKREVLCASCARQIIGYKEKVVNTLLRETDEKIKRSKTKGEKKNL